MMIRRSLWMSLAAAVLTALAASPSTAAETYYNWLGEDYGLWSDTANWKDGVPGSWNSSCYFGYSTIVDLDETRDLNGFGLASGVELTILGMSGSSHAINFFKGSFTGGSRLCASNVVFRARGGSSYPTFTINIPELQVLSGGKLSLETHGNSSYAQKTTTMSSAITGGGAIELPATGNSGAKWLLSGDNSGFEGSFSMLGSGNKANVTFKNASSGSGSASWNFESAVDGAVLVDIPAGGTLEFGELTGNGAISNVNGEVQIVLQVGGKGTSFRCGVDFCGTGLKKVGAGAMTFTGSNAGAVTVENGMLTMTAGQTIDALSIGANGSFKIAYDDSWGVGEVTLLTVADGANAPDASAVAVDSRRVTVSKGLDGSGAAVYTATVAAVASLTWNGSDGDAWQNGDTHWLLNDVATDFRANDHVEFTDAAFGANEASMAVVIGGDVAPSAVSVDIGEGKTYTFSGDYAVKNSEATLAKSGDGTLSLANEGNELANVAIGAGTLKLTANALPGIALDNSGTLEVDAGAGEVVLGAVTGAGTVKATSGTAVCTASMSGIKIENNATVRLQNTSTTVSSANVISGTGQFVLDGIQFFTTASAVLSTYTGGFYVKNGGTLCMNENGAVASNPFGTGAIYLDNGKITTGSNASSGPGYGRFLENAIYVVGTGNEIKNNMTRNNNSYVELAGSLFGSGTVTMTDSSSSNGTKGIYLSGDNGEFEGVFNFTTTSSGSYTTSTTGNRNYSGFKNASAGSSNAVWNVTEGSKYLGIYGGGTHNLGALNIPADMAYGVSIGTANTVVNIGNKADSALRSAFYNNVATINKVGANTSLTLGPAFSMVTGSSIVVKEGTLVCNAETLEGVDVTFENGTAAALLGDDLDVSAIYTIFKTSGTITLKGRQTVKSSTTARGRWKLEVDRTSEEGYDILTAQFVRQGTVVVLR